MAQAALVLTRKDQEVAFAILTGKGRKGKKAENEYTLAVEVTKKEKKSIIKDIEEFWDENKSSKAKAPKDNPEEWFTVSKNDKKNFVFWASEVVSQGVTRKVAPGKGFGMKNFEKMGAGSIVDVEYRAFHYDNEWGEGVGLRLSAVLLKDFTKHTGGGGYTLEGEELEDSGVTASDNVGDEKKKKKKKKKK